MPPLRVPTQFAAAFQFVRGLADDQFRTLLNAVATAEPTMSPGTLADVVPDGIIADHDVSALDVVQALMSLTSLRRFQDWSVDEMATRISESPDLQVPQEAQPDFASRIGSLLAARPIALLGKAVDMATEHDKVFVGVKILTDVRPLFGEDVDDPPQGAVLSHTVKLGYVHDEGVLGNLYVTLDDEDLVMLKDAIARAEAKAVTMKRLLGTVNVPYLGPEV